MRALEGEAPPRAVADEPFDPPPVLRAELPNRCGKEIAAISGALGAVGEARRRVVRRIPPSPGDSGALEDGSISGVVAKEFVAALDVKVGNGLEVAGFGEGLYGRQRQIFLTGRRVRAGRAEERERSMKLSGKRKGWGSPVSWNRTAVSKWAASTDESASESSSAASMKRTRASSTSPASSRISPSIRRAVTPEPSAIAYWNREAASSTLPSRRKQVARFVIATMETGSSSMALRTARSASSTRPMLK